MRFASSSHFVIDVAYIAVNSKKVNPTEKNDPYMPEAMLGEEIGRLMNPEKDKSFK